MPIVKIPLEHKFGIVSLSRAESLLAQSRGKISSRKAHRSSFAVEITQEFVTKYNGTAEGARSALDAVIQRALLHSKYKLGLLKKAPSNPASEDVAESADVSSSWLELTLLSQCYGQHQQDALLILAISLNHAPLLSSHIPSLLYIAGMCFQWLKSDQLSENILRTGELLLLKILYLVSLRLHYHHLTGALADSTTRDDTRQLKADLEGFENREKAYRNFPEALLQWKLSLEIGLLICETYGKVESTLSPTYSDTTAAPTESPDIGSRQRTPGSMSQSVVHGPGLAPVLWHTLDVWHCVYTGNDSLEEAVDDLLSCSTNFDSQRWLEGALAMCLLCIASQVNLQILTLLQSMAAGSSMSQSTTKQSSPRSSPSKGTSSKPSNLPSLKRETRFKLPPSELSSPMTQASRQLRKPSTLNMLGIQPEFDAYLLGSAVTLCTAMASVEEELSEQSESFYQPTLPSTVGTQSLIESEVIPETLPSTHTSNTTMPGFGSTNTVEDLSLSFSKSAALLNKSFTLSNVLSVSGDSSNSVQVDTQSPLMQPADTGKKVALHTPSEMTDRVEMLDLRYPTQEESKDGYAQSMAPLSDGVAVPGSQVAPSTVYRRSVYSTPDLNVEDTTTAPPCFKHWSTEVSMLYTLGMADAVIYGQTSVIRRKALLGETSSIQQQGTLTDYGLMQLAEFSLTDSSSHLSASWAVRHVAVLGLSRVCKVCQQMPIRDGLSNVAWKRLMDRHTSEEDSRVLEAFKLTQACPDVDSALLAVDEQTLSSPLLAHIADGLCRLFLPTTTTQAGVVQRTRAKTPAVVQKKDDLSETVKKAHPRVCTRNSVRGAPSFNTRTMGALNKIAEEHWKRQMNEESKAEEKMRVAEEERWKAEYEEKMKRKQEKLSRRNPKPTTHTQSN